MFNTEPGWQGFLELCLRSESKEILDTLFDLFLTFEEKKNLALRYLIIQGLLAKKETQRELAQRLQVSIAKITRGSNELKRMSPQQLQYLKERI